MPNQIIKKSSRAPKCEIITIGTELLLGQISDTNTIYLARELGGAGISVRFRTAVGDLPEEIRKALVTALDRCDLVVTTGGLGPTGDDLTRETVACVAGVDLEFRQDLMDQIENIFHRYGYDMPENNRKQAFVPAGSQAIPNPVGTAPSFVCEINGKPVVCLPGVPRELEYLFKSEVMPRLRKTFGLKDQKIIYKVLKTVGIGESRVDRLIGDLVKPGQNPEVGLLASQGEIKIRIAAKARNEDMAYDLIRPIEKEIHMRLGKKIFGKDNETLEHVIDSLLAEKGLNLSIIETFTGGLAAQRLHRLPSPCLLKSTVIPDKKRLENWLQVCDLHGSDAALKAAEKARHAAGADIGLAIVGEIHKRGEDFQISGHTAAAGKRIEKTFQWEMGGDISTIQLRGALIGLNSLRLAILEA